MQIPPNYTTPLQHVESVDQEVNGNPHLFDEPPPPYHMVASLSSFSYQGVSAQNSDGDDHTSSLNQPLASVFYEYMRLQSAPGCPIFHGGLSHVPPCQPLIISLNETFPPKQTLIVNQYEASHPRPVITEPKNRITAQPQLVRTESRNIPISIYLLISMAQLAAAWLFIFCQT